jgi:uncharacterized phage protein gp47/JayE
MTALWRGPDGVLRQELAFTTTSERRFFYGTLSSGVVEVEVSLRGAAFSADPSLVSFLGGSFTVPNPAAYPAGLDLVSGENVLRIRTVDALGRRSAAATVTVQLTTDGSEAEFPPPSEITLERLDDSVEITVRAVDDARVTGYHFYAATESGGGATGYARINLHAVTTATTTVVATPLFTLTAEGAVDATRPRYFRAILRHENTAGDTLQTDANQRVALPETVRGVRTEISMSATSMVQRISFVHRRTADATSTPPTLLVSALAAQPLTDPLYYVATAVYYDAASNEEFESYFSAEVIGAPIQVRHQTTTLPAAGRQRILEDAILSIYRQDSNRAVQPGSVLRDTFLDPLVTEAERVRFLVDFFYRASSFDTLLRVDDPDGTGASIAPAASAYKRALAAALFLENVNDVQAVVDGAFEKLAANVGCFRRPGVRSRGEVRFYTPTTPTQTLPLPLGTAVYGGRYRTVRAAELPVDRLASYYNPSTRQYSVTVPIQAVDAGSAGNVGARQITTGAPYGFSVVNDAPTFGGKDRETNAQLAARARRALAAVDTGTEQGYLQTAASVAGVVQAVVVRAGDVLMQRDYQQDLGRHVGGRVDVWAQGVRAAQVSDTFTFTYDQRQDVQFVVVGDPLAYRFRALDATLTPTRPLAAMLNYEELGLGLRNATTGFRFNLTDVTVVNYNTIQLAQTATIIQPPVALADVVLGDYRYPTATRHVFTRQPVSRIFSVFGERTGYLDGQSFLLGKPSPPLQTGCSSAAEDYVQIVPSSDVTATRPSGAPLRVTGELHTLNGEYNEYLFRLGADLLSVRVTSTDGVTTYRGPYHASGVSDYLLVSGTATEPLALRRVPGGALEDGASVLVDYLHEENFTVTYQTNLVPAALQAALAATAHATADVLAKEAVQVPVDLSATIILKRGYSRSTADTALRNNLQYLLSSSRLGMPLRRSEVIATLNSTAGVDHVVVPLTLMARGANSVVVRNDLETRALGSALRLEAWSGETIGVWLIRQELDYPTTTGGGLESQFRAVYQDDAALSLGGAIEVLATTPRTAFIIGDEGSIIPRYTDDDTLTAAGYVTATQRALERRNRSKNRVLVSLATGTSPSQHRYWTTYVTAAATGDHDITPSKAEYLVLGALTFTYDEAAR